MSVWFVFGMSFLVDFCRALGCVFGSGMVRAVFSFATVLARSCTLSVFLYLMWPVLHIQHPVMQLFCPLM